MRASELQKELRIGNYLLGKCVDELDERKEWWEQYQIKDAEDLMGVKDGWDERIPLTEEHLIKFGFDNVRKNMLFCHNEYHNRRINEGAYYVEPVGDAFNHWYLYHKVKMITSNIRYVHQLQNLYFALCGKELELK